MRKSDEPSTVSRSEYVGRGNVQAVRAARKNAGLNDAFPRSDPLLKEFRDFLRMSGVAEKDNANKVTTPCHNKKQAKLFLL